ncbi:BatD family protein [Mesonia maritima]|uniref:BatD family protein n=1 Tax=Mesonia maritima TaxID=1793873 RepID=UPI00363D9D0D
MQVPSDRRDIFGRRLSETVQKTIAADSRKIQVKPLPTEGKPATFTGAVGSFQFSVNTNKTSLDATESLEATVRVSGNGNLKLFQLPKLETPGSLEVYEPEHLENVKTNANGMYGSITDTYTIVPQLKGKYPISPVVFSYFDVNSESYKTLRSDELLINVENGPTQVASASSSTENGVVKQNVPTEKKQFRYLKLSPDLQEKNEVPFFKSVLFWVLLLVPFLAIPLAILFGKKREARANDVEGRKLRKADKLAKKYLSEAKKNLGDQQRFYDSLERALHNYLKAKLSIKTGEMSKEKIKDLLDNRGASSENNLAFIQLLESCEFARYTPASKTSMQQDYDKAVSVIAGLDKQI